jgi:hypothetical protein
MPLQQLQFRPGVNREGTTLANEGGWFECDKVRFRSGYPEKIGGWTPISNQTYQGVARGLINWVTNKGYNLLGVGTSTKYYIESGGLYNDVTPYRVFATTGSAPNCFTVTNGSANVTVAITNHSLVTDDVIYFENSTDVDGIPAVELNTRHLVSSVINTNAFVVTVTSTANANATGGGANVTFESYPFQQTLIDPFTTINGSSIVTVTDVNHGAVNGDTVNFSGASSVGGLTISGNYIITYINSNAYTINAGSNANADATGGGTVVAKYELNIGQIVYSTITGWGAGYWGGLDLNAAVNYLNGGINASVTTITVDSTTGFSATGVILIDQELITYTGTSSTTFTGCVRGAQGTTAASHSDNAVVYNAATFNGWGQSANETAGAQLRLWSHANYGEYLIINPRNEGLYLWIPTYGTNDELTSLDEHAELLSINNSGLYETDANCPSVSTLVMVSDSSRFVISFGCNDYGSDDQVPLLVRWSDQENYSVWTPAITNQAGSFLLSSGSYIVTAVQTRQEILVFTDASVWSMKYVGPPYVWSFDILSHNISMAGPNAIAAANNIVYWMGTDKFYVYTGRVETLPCSLRQYVFGDINMTQSFQFFAGSNEGYSEIWWFYCSANSEVVDRYVIYNYLDKVWYYGTMERTAWLDSSLRAYPMAATYSHNIVFHENGVDDVETSGNILPIEAYIQSSDFDIGDGHNFGFVWRMIPDITFDGSTTPAPNKPEVTFTVRPRQNPGSAYGTGATPTVQSAQSYANQKTYTVQEFTEIVYTRVRGRQMAFKISSNTVGTQWQLGVPRIDTRPDGRR